MASKDEDILATARKRFERCREYYNESREKQKDDIRFEAASPDDPWQWPEEMRRKRQQEGRPCLTINKLPQHVSQVVNDIRQNRPAMRFRPAAGDASAETADILNGLARHIEAISDADIAYDSAAQNEVVHGEGYVRVLTQFVSDNAFEQDIFISPVNDVFTCFLDPDAEDPAGADARYAFLAKDYTEEDFKAEFPDADAVDWDFDDHGDWFSRDKHVRVAEYFSLEKKADTLHAWANGATSYASDEKLPAGVIQGEKPARSRKVQRTVMVWRKITGNQILESNTYNWRYIPIARVLGNVKFVDGKPIVSGIVRNAKDAQRQYNTTQTAIAERVALAPKTPWIAPYEATVGFEDKWSTANTVAHDVLNYNHLDESGQPIPAPQRVSPATIEPGLQQLMLTAADDIKSTTGQYDASLGQRSNETSGKAIMARQREGDTSTYHYVNNLGVMVRHVGRIVLDIIPTVYDTARVMRILGEDDSESFARLDPEAPQAYQEVEDEHGEIMRIFNPNVGTYDVVSSVGPSFTTRRVEAAQAMTELVQAAPQLWGVVGDLLVKSQDWPGAEEMAKRLKLTLIPPVQQMIDQEDKKTEIPPQVQMAMQQMQQQMQQANEMMAQAAQHISQLEAEKESKELELLAKLAGVSVQEYDAATRRLTALGTALKPEDVIALAQQTVEQAMAREPLESAEEAENIAMQSMGMPEDSPQEMAVEAVPEMPQEPPPDPAAMTDEQLMGELQ